MVLARWTAHPARRRPRDLFLVLAVVLLTAGAVLASLESLLLTALSAVFLVVAVAQFLFPTHYTLTDAGVSERRLWRHKVRQWADLRRLQVGPAAALVSPFARPHWLDRYRGLILMFDGADRDQVIAILRERMDREQVMP
jgi:hypothetical protein